MLIINQKNSMPVIAASYLGPSLAPNADDPWDEAELPLNPDDLVQKIMGQPMRRAGRFIKLVCCGALTCWQSVPKEVWQGKRTGIFLATGLGNIDEILPFITQVFKHEGGFPSPNQFANSVSNAAAFFLARLCEVKGVVLTVSQEELSFESALWLAQSYLESGEIDLALVGACDVFTPSIADYRERLDLQPGSYRPAPMGESSSWFLLGHHDGNQIGEILSVDLENRPPIQDNSSDGLLRQCAKQAAKFLPEAANQQISHIFLPGFRITGIDEASWAKNGWSIDDYISCCGISSTASAYGLARSFLSGKPALIIHRNHQGVDRQAIITAVVN